MAFTAGLEQLPTCNQTNSFSLIKIVEQDLVCLHGFVVGNYAGCIFSGRQVGDNMDFCRMVEGAIKDLELPEASALRWLDVGFSWDWICSAEWKLTGKTNLENLCVCWGKRLG